jgi:hypothetical protein
MWNVVFHRRTPILRRCTMHYALLIWEKHDQQNAVSAAEWEQMMEGHTAFWNEYQPQGKVVSGAGLKAHTTATTVRASGDSRSVTDGPFAESREVIGGFYVVDCADLDEAIVMAKKIPIRDGEGVEIRPLEETG